MNQAQQNNDDSKQQRRVQDTAVVGGGVDATTSVVGKKQKGGCTLLERFLSSLPELFQGELLDFLSINDTTNLSMTCRQMRDMVTTSSRRCSYPCIVWEERRPTQLEYVSRTFFGGGTVDRVVVAQDQNFRFIFRTAAQVSIQVDFSLVNELWDEHDNKQDSESCRDLSAFPSSTQPVVSVFQPEKSNQEQCELFEAYRAPGGDAGGGDDNDSDYAWTVFFENYRDVTQNVILTPNDEEGLRTVMNMVWKCAQRISVFPDETIYPSAEYLMHKFPSWLHQYFPASVPTTSPNHRDREIVVEFSYRPAPTLADWRENLAYVPTRPRLCLLDLPWYQNGDDESETAARKAAKRPKTG